MNHEIYLFTFSEKVSFSEIEESMFLATMAAESLHGRSSLRMDAAFTLDAEKRTAAVDARTDVGRAIARIFTGFLTREFGEDKFKVDRVTNLPQGSPESGLSPKEAACQS